MTIVCVTVAAARKPALPGWSAAITQLPAARIDTVPPLTEQMDGEPDEKVTARPELAVADTANVPFGA